MKQSIKSSSQALQSSQFYLVIVESPTKAKMLTRYLGAPYHVLASYGHVRDLAKRKAIDCNNHFEMHYELLETKSIPPILAAWKKADRLFLATDPDREGEAIAWHLSVILYGQNNINNIKLERVVFHEITQKAILEAFKHPRDLNYALIEAYKARRTLDYLVGFTLSPLLWKKIHPKLSAGRVQTPALGFIVTRESEIRQFQTQEHWSLDANLLNNKQDQFKAKLIKIHHKKIEPFAISSESAANNLREQLLKESRGYLTIIDIQKKQRKRHAAPPLITSTLQQAAVQQLGLTAQRVMQLAQQLYEAGLITYMRTDSTQLAPEAVDNIRTVINKNYGSDYLPSQQRIFKKKSKNAQEAHEAIRPTMIDQLPENLNLNSQALIDLYRLIWKRTVACQMSDALIDMTVVDLATAEGSLFRASGFVMKHLGFLSAAQDLLNESLDKLDKSGESGQDKPLPSQLTVGDRIKIDNLLAHQHFTEPPPRYTEATLIKTLEEYGIGRPSTYATIVHTLKTRQYVTLENKRFHPTDMGEIVSQFLTNYFIDYVNNQFTAKLEDQLDAIARGELVRETLLSHFWTPFKARVDTIEHQVSRREVTQKLLDRQCPKCQKALIEKLGRHGRFIGCSGFPECDYIEHLENHDNNSISHAATHTNNNNNNNNTNAASDKICPVCQYVLKLREGKNNNKFYGCSNYPNCHYIEPLTPLKHSGIACPSCHIGELIEKKSRWGQSFYACSHYPTCRYAVSHEPVKQSCPNCQWPILMRKTSKKSGEILCCPQKECNYKNL